ncbi:hypothetical protein AB4099_12475 [Bosea sp. 2KB_26]|uniref:hypothetical protein n=1 Tax=Bosea sp. 2KB_26 TaxID=3237475 RepID=UPI003F914DE8
MNRHWSDGLEHTTQFVIFPPLGREAEFGAAKPRLLAHLKARFPDYSFGLTAVAMDDEISILPVCGTVGDDANGRLKKPPVPARMQEIKAVMGAFDPGWAGLS